MALRYVESIKWLNQTGSSKGFAVFADPISGIRAGMVNLNNGYLKKNFNTLEKIFQKYAPTSDGNNPAKYATRVLGILNDPVNKPKLLVGHNIDSVNRIILPTPENLHNLAYAIIQVETGGQFGKYYKELLCLTYAYQWIKFNKQPNIESGNDFLYVNNSGIKSSNLKLKGFDNPEEIKKKTRAGIVLTAILALILTWYLLKKIK